MRSDTVINTTALIWEQLSLILAEHMWKLWYKYVDVPLLPSTLHIYNVVFIFCSFFLIYYY